MNRYDHEKNRSRVLEEIAERAHVRGRRCASMSSSKPARRCARGLGHRGAHTNEDALTIWRESGRPFAFYPSEPVPGACKHPRGEQFKLPRPKHHDIVEVCALCMTWRWARTVETADGLGRGPWGKRTPVAPQFVKVLTSAIAKQKRDNAKAAA